jgi:hypothetical protein
MEIDDILAQYDDWDEEEDEELRKFRLTSCLLILYKQVLVVFESFRLFK